MALRVQRRAESAIRTHSFMHQQRTEHTFLTSLFLSNGTDADRLCSTEQPLRSACAEQKRLIHSSLRHRKECSLIVLFVIEGAKGNNMCSPSSYTDLLEMSIEKPLNFDHSLLQNIELWLHSQNIRYLWVISQRSQWALWVISQRIYCFLGDILCKISRKNVFL